MSNLVYYSSSSGNTHRFVERLAIPALRITAPPHPILHVNTPFILIVPTYGGGGIQGAVPAPVIRFLNQAENRRLLKGVISSGNRSFGAGFCLAGKVIAEKCQVPWLYRFELLGTPEDVENVRKGVKQFWLQQP
ncbi:class Ib ribonucleoside-diphosphate reductase assembly flavoprotein NrdI [Mangrovibacter yixingensis]|uniref:class Ib ribonucleoside-diphosphate reductase assembly flavoprotein NrdI n=1 Tax=Mangrovibacter yixingensis TaxID=1529639 RepID=UPI001CFA0D5D|nr:class Ib ribonucleoside-diphosphate reductase assembly flavoprotein NrdI [Mangrovibacter yixingensis]